MKRWGPLRRQGSCRQSPHLWATCGFVLPLRVVGDGPNGRVYVSNPPTCAPLVIWASGLKRSNPLNNRGCVAPGGNYNWPWRDPPTTCQNLDRGGIWGGGSAARCLGRGIGGLAWGGGAPKVQGAARDPLLPDAYLQVGCVLGGRGVWGDLCNNSVVTKLSRLCWEESLKDRCVAPLAAALLFSSAPQ